MNSEMDQHSTSTGTFHEKMKAIMKTIQEYLRTQSKESYEDLLKAFEYLQGSRDASIFDLSTVLGAQFTISLFDLLALDNLNALLWSGLSILEVISSMNSGSHSFSNLSYKFMPVLAKLLTGTHTQEKKLRLLSLLQSFTYGICIQWPEPYLKPLFQSLCANVKSLHDKEVTLSLSILVNLLHRNPPAAYTFMRFVDVKDFIRLIITKDINTAFRLEVCKFMVLVTNVTEIYPDEKELLKFISLTFVAVIECVGNRNTTLLKHCVDFFCDVSWMKKLKPSLLTYPSYGTDIDKIVKLLEKEDKQCLCEPLLLQFLNSIVALRPPEIVKLFGNIVSVAFNIMRAGSTISRGPALLLLLTLSREIDIKDDALSALLLQGLPLLVGILKENSGIPREELLVVVQILRECTNDLSMKKAILSELGPNVLRKLFDSLLLTNCEAQGGLSVEDATFYVEALSLMSKFVSQDAAWLHQFSLLTQQRAVQTALATALKSAPPSVKSQVILLPTVVGFSADYIPALAECMSEDSVENCRKDVGLGCLYDTPPIFREKEKDQLSNILSRLENNKGDGTVNDVITAFEYHVADEAHEMRILTSSLEVAHERIAFLTQYRNSSKDEIMRLRRYLFTTRQSLEQTKIERDAALVSAETAEASEKKVFKECQALQRQFEIQLQEQLQENQRLSQLMQKEIEEKTRANKRIELLQKEISSLEEINKANLRQLIEKDNEIKEQKQKIHQLEIIKNAIHEISGGTKKIEK